MTDAQATEMLRILTAIEVVLRRIDQRLTPPPNGEPLSPELETAVLLAFRGGKVR